MGIFNIIFGRKPKKDVHIHLHVDGILKLNGIGNMNNTGATDSKGNDNKTKVELVDSIPDIEPELGNVEIPDVDFGDEDE